MACFPSQSTTLGFTKSNLDSRFKIDWKQLCCGTTDNRLSFAKDEALADPETVEISRQWDIDSFLVRIPSLGVHRDGFRISYSPPFQKQITQNARVSFAGHALHQTSHLLLGQGVLAAGAGYECFVMFPHIPLGRTNGTHLRLEMQGRWFDDIVLPALRLSCPPEVVQHHPCSFEDIRGKAGARQEFFLTGGGRAMDIRYTIPEPYLESFWQHVVALCNPRGPAQLDRPFRQPFLVVCAHGLKLITKRSTLAEAGLAYLAHLSTVFSLDLDEPSLECWLDVGVEDVPQGKDRAITLLRKSACVDAWARQFASPGPGADHLLVSKYPWQATRDAGGASVELRPRNRFRAAGGPVYNKTYNIHKELFATPLKEHQPFSHGRLEGLAYTQTLMEQWNHFNTYRGPSAPADQRKQLVNAYKSASSRVSNALCTSKQTSFGVRQEFRIPLQMFRRLIQTDAPSDPATDTDHRPYWILRTSTVNTFVAEQANRWILLLDYIAARTDVMAKQLTNEEQLNHGVMASILIRVLHYHFTGDGRNMAAILKREWRQRQYRRPRIESEGESEEPVSDASDSEFVDSDIEDSDTEASDTSEIGRGEGQKAFGLGVEELIAARGYLLLPAALFVWTGPVPVLTERARQRQAIAQKNAFQKGFTRNRNIQQQIVTEDRLFQQLRAILVTDDQEERTVAYRTMAELVLNAYVQDVFAILAQRRISAPDRRARHLAPASAIRQLIQDAGLDEAEAAGHAGLNARLVSRLCGCRPRIIETRPAGAHNSRSVMGRYNTHYWGDKLNGLFDLGELQDRRRDWEQMPFRQLHRRFHDWLGQLGAGHQPQYRAILREYAAVKLQLIPQYDLNKMSVMYKALPHNSPEMKEEIKAMSALQKTNWVAPHLVPELDHQARRLFRGFTPSRWHAYLDMLQPSRLPVYANSYQPVCPPFPLHAVLSYHELQEWFPLNLDILQSKWDPALVALLRESLSE